MPNFEANDQQTSAPQDKVQSVIELLISWQLPQLCGKFQEEEICTIALLHLTDADICELIPKIGPRAIFRAALDKWKRQQLRDMSGQLRQIADKEVIDTCLEPFVSPMPSVVKVESISAIAEGDERQQQYDRAVGGRMTVERVHEGNEGDAVSLSDIDNQHVNEQEEETNQARVKRDEANLTNEAENETETESTRIKLTGKRDASVQLSVNDILRQSFDGRKALKFFEVNKQLDANHRRRCVKAVIGVAIDQRLTMTSQRFQCLAEQFVRVFPGESLSTYFVPRKGYVCPRGALYNKYMNMCRHLRRDGLLEYRLKRSSRNARKRLPLNSVQHEADIDIDIE